MRSILCTARSGAILAVVLTLVLALAAPVAAGATTLEAVSIALMYESLVSENPTLVISARLPDDVPLPAEMVLPLPENANVLWVGEFFGGEERENVPVLAEQEVRNGAPALVFTLTESRIALADVGFPDSLTTIQPGVYETGFDIVMPVDSAAVYAAVALPQNMMALTSSEPVVVTDEPDGNRYHAIERTDVVAGERITLSVQAEELAEPDRINETVPWMVALVIAVIIGAAVVLIFVRKRNTDTET